MSPTAFTLLVQTRLGVLPDGDPGALTLAALDARLPALPPSEPPTVVLPSGGTLTADTLALAILAQGRRFVDLKEVKPNAEWDNPATPGPDTALVEELRRRMRAAPWQEKWAYCAAFVEAVVVAALEQCKASPDQIKRFSSVMQPGVMNSFYAFEKLGLVHDTPTSGSIWLAQHGTTAQGHAGLVIRTEGIGQMLTIEANTSRDPNASGAQQREGDWITHRIRQRTGAGELHTRGFIRPASILKLCGIA